MEKQTFINSALEQIRNKNLQVPFLLDQGSEVTDLELYLKSLEKAYLSTKDPRLTLLFRDKIQQLIQL